MRFPIASWPDSQVIRNWSWDLLEHQRHGKFEIQRSKMMKHRWNVGRSFRKGKTSTKIFKSLKKTQSVYWKPWVFDQWNTSELQVLGPGGYPTMGSYLCYFGGIFEVGGWDGFWGQLFPSCNSRNPRGEMRPETMEHGFLVGWPKWWYIVIQGFQKFIAQGACDFTARSPISRSHGWRPVLSMSLPTTMMSYGPMDNLLCQNHQGMRLAGVLPRIGCTGFGLSGLWFSHVEPLIQQDPSTSCKDIERWVAQTCWGN